MVGLIVDHGLRPELDRRSLPGRELARGARHRGSGSCSGRGRSPRPGSRRRRGPRATSCSPTGAGRRACSTCCSAIIRTIRPRPWPCAPARGSGPDGLAGMAAVREIAGLRLLRPLLGGAQGGAARAARSRAASPGSTIRATARRRSRAPRCGAGPAWMRPRLGRTGAGPGSGARRRSIARPRSGSRATPGSMAAGFVLLDRGGARRRADASSPRRVLQQTLLAVGGGHYPPRRARLERLLEALRDAPGRRGGRSPAAGFCPAREHLLVCREAGVIADVLAPRAGVWQRWDRRFAVRVGGGSDGLRVRGARRRGLAAAARAWRRRRRARAAGPGAGEPAGAVAARGAAGGAAARPDRARRARQASTSRRATGRRSRWPARRSQPACRMMLQPSARRPLLRRLDSLC